MRCRAFAPATLAALVLAAHDGLAQSASELARRELLTRAEAAAAAGEHARAVELLERAGAIRWTPSHRLFAAREYVQVRRVVEALSAATSCQREARADATLRNRAAIEQACTELTTSLRDRVGRIVLQVPQDAPATTSITIGGQPVAQALWGVEFPVDPGPIEVVAEGPGLRAMRMRVDVEAGRNTAVAVAIVREPAVTAVTAAVETPAVNRAPPEDPRATTAVVAPVTNAPIAAQVAPITLPPRSPTPIADQRGAGAGPWVLVASAATVVVGGAVLGAVYGANLAGLDADCAASSRGLAPSASNTQTTCVDSGQRFAARIRETELLGNLTIVALSAGAAALGGGIIWAVAARSRGSTQRALTLAPSVTASGAGFAIGGRF